MDMVEKIVSYTVTVQSTVGIEQIISYDIVQFKQRIISLRIRRNDITKRNIYFQGN